MIEKRASLNMFLPGIAWFFIICILVFLPGKDVPDLGWMSRYQVDKAVHAGMFTILVFLFCLPYFSVPGKFLARRNYLAVIAAISCLWGIAIEFIQKYFVTGRSFDLWDWAADSLGVLIACFICIKIFKNGFNWRNIRVSPSRQ